MEPFYPLRALVCERCFLVQLEEFETPEEIFSDYAYFSSFSTSWLDHAKRYVDAMVERFGLDESSQVVELATNDGYLLQYFARARHPGARHRAGRERRQGRRREGHPDLVEFFGAQTATELAERAQGRPAARQQRARPRAGPQRLRRAA